MREGKSTAGIRESYEERRKLFLSSGTMKKIICQQCKKNFYILDYDSLKTKFCSMKCFYNSPNHRKEIVNHLFLAIKKDKK